LGKFEELYEIEEAHEIEGRGYWETGSSLRSHWGNLRNCMKLKKLMKLKEEVIGKRGARCARMGEI
jgi:hypothetical protein